MKIVMKRIYDLKPAEYNPRILTKKQKSDLEKSIKRFGVVDPAIVNTVYETLCSVRSLTIPITVFHLICHSIRS
jgi:ParB-like chromosome segregation protein Spo0J